MRKTKLVIIPATPVTRDSGKTFLLTEKDAVSTEKWAQRAILAMAASGIDIPPEVIRMGLGAIVAAGFRSLMTMAFADAEPLLDEMLSCVQVVPDRTKPDVVRRLDPEDIEEVATLLLLRSEVVELHTGFSIAGWLSKLGQSAATNPQSTSPDMPTSPKSSGT